MASSARTPDNTEPPKTVFLAAAVVFFVLSLSVADSIGFVPYYIDGTAPNSVDDSASLADLEQSSQDDLLMLDANGNLLPPRHVTASDTNAKTQLPVHITIGRVGVDLPVQNPSTTNVDALDALLVKGPARYIDSAKLGESGNMIIFAHSSHLPVVHNQMYKAFNQIPNMKPGDTIRLRGEDGTNYLYSVTSVRSADVNDNVSISLARDQGTKLTLVTCDTLTGKSARFILEADFIGTE
ncbi:MAG: sortase [Candidatus Kaiserbacteria bacterium]|nr:sortase [Candidatus Kaiserbacteria bacterium]